MVDERNDTVASEEPLASADTAASEAPALQALEELRREKESLQDRLLRTAAEFDNYRKRTERERRDQADSAVAEAVQDLLPIIDNLELALSAPATGEVEGYRKGVELILRQMQDLLRRRGVKPIQATGAEFDPRLHQAVAHEASTEHPEGYVIEELRRGYVLGDRLLRPAMVKVAKA